jgi:hypothetical protein
MDKALPFLHEVGNADGYRLYAHGLEGFNESEHPTAHHVVKEGLERDVDVVEPLFEELRTDHNPHNGPEWLA